MRSVINKIFDIGLLPTNEVKENKKIKLLNIFCFTWSILIIVITVFDIIFNRELEGSLIMHGISYALITTIFIFQYKRLYILARVLFISSIIGVTYVFANYTTPLSLIENFYFIYPLIGLILIDKKWINISILIVCFLLYFVPNIYYGHYPNNTILPVLVFSVFVAAYVILNYSDNLNKKHEKELLLSKEKLEQAYLELEERKKSELASLQLKALKAQMNPHFLFNTINSIQSLILTGEKEEAYKYLTKFSLLMRESIKTSEMSFVDFSIELSMLEKYLELEKLRFKKDFEYEIKGEKNIERIKIPSAVIQPFVENAIRYGLLHKTKGEKRIVIEFYQEEVFVCSIIDNGIGIEASKQINTLNRKLSSEDSSIKAIENRLQLLKEFYKTDIGVVYEKVKEGTKVVVKIPYVN
ncbi:histidine kinase [uncultured Tenacibaculum sp.]|uniref:sensor histidine kinase n=1 Tax=uncultured Tenacibaculum sp. TaxID=174713 RepID=UPI00262D3E9B|nr:histidine kinase [uncultured Tenacibaculum sp.]